ncbi:VWFA and cache domain-containing protein 1-like [Pecten maximus]|uniref:VWFA and cache domain-containing protein 1-like n=1 Tax=Pecten maximus TaxID=6579 RepID=UPI001458DEEF|nr:VWFA and cache domain-containing protein 1-like [Pecten maximus]
MYRQWNIYFVFILLSIVPLFQLVKSDITKMEPDEIKNKWIGDFKTSVGTLAEKVLNITEIKKQLYNNRKHDEVKLINGMAEFNRIHTKVLLHLSTVHGVVLNLTSAIEKELDDHEHGIPPKTIIPLPVCCSVDSSHGSYEGRLRQKVDLTKPCIGTRGGDLFQTDVLASLQHMKQNYQDTPAVLWQYFSTVDGHFTQYPSSNRHCDSQGHLISPLTQEWFVDKLFMEKKNVVIVYDVGVIAGMVVGPENRTMSMYIHEAVLRILDTLTPDDQVNVVAFNDTAHAPTQCDKRLFVANQVNCDKIRRFLTTTNIPGGGSDFTSGLLKAYEMLISEKRYLSDKFKKRSTQLIFLTPGKPTNNGIEKLFTTISNKQEELDKNVHHFVYTFDDSLDEGVGDILSSIAHQELPGWPMISNFSVTFMPPVGPRGDFHVYNATGFVQGAATYYHKLQFQPPKKRDTGVTIIGPKSDSHSGLIMTSTIPVFHNNSVYGVAAIDTSMATIFAEILNFDIGVHSYAFLMESQHGQVLLHPQLRPPGDIRQESPVYPHLSVVEPTLSDVQIFNLTHAGTETQQLRAQVRMGRSSYKSGTPLDNSAPSNATLIYSKIHGIQFVLVLVKFDLDSDILIPQHLAQDLKLHAPYHRLDEISLSPVHNKPQDDSVCSYNGNFIATEESVIKLSPSVFRKPEQYKYSNEDVNQIIEINSFLEHSKNTSLIRLEVKEEIEHILRSTDEIDKLWRPTAKQVLERYFGTPSGVLRIFPGMPFRNTYNHLSQVWFRRSVALPHQFVFSSGQFSRFTSRNMLLMSKAVSENIADDPQGPPLVKLLQGVVGVVISHRQLNAILYQVSGCGGTDIECHLLDNNGYVLPSDGKATAARHLTQQFSWLASHLITNRQMKPFWCTSLSEGQHRLSYSMNLTFDQRTGSNRCESYVIGTVTETNLFLLVLYNRTKSGCDTSFDDTDTCTKGTNGQCNKCLTTDQSCESPCQCLADFDQCSSHYDLHDVRTTACYNDPLVDENVPSSFQPKPPRSDVKNCSLPCVAVEDKDECLSLQHCQWGDDYPSFPTCGWRNDSDIVHSTSQMTTPGVPTPPLRPPTKQTVVSSPGPGPAIPLKRTSTSNPQTVPVNSPPPKKTTPNPTVLPTSSGQTNIPTETPTEMTTQAQTSDIDITSTDSSVVSNQAIISHSSTLSKHITSGQIPLSTSNPAHETTQSQENMRQKNRKTESTDDKTGLVIGLIVAVMVVLLIVGLVIYKVRKRLKNQTNGARKGSIFDGVLFNRTSERAELTQSSRPYQQIM